jgi:glucose/arabinose dehydrogenase
VTPVVPVLLAALLAVACSEGAHAQRSDLVHQPPEVLEVAPPAVALEPAFGDLRFQRPLDAVQAPGDERNWYVVEQRGLILRVHPGESGFVGDAWLDIRDVVSRKGNEEGLLGLAFSPHYDTAGAPDQGAFYVNYSVKNRRMSRLSRFHCAPGQEEVDWFSEEVLLQVDQPYENHNGGGLMFGPDGYLYYSLGDGGSGGDPQGNAQNTRELLGSILRLDVSPQPDGKPYGIPPDNPLLDRPGARPEIWAYGLRNPWRFSFDRETGEMWTGDVGQRDFEFIHIVRKGGNHGWDLVEGFHRFELPVAKQPPEPLVPPIFEYPHPDGLSITGGYVYRGSRIPSLVGWYVFGDYATKRLWAIRRAGEGKVEHMTLLADSVAMASFAEDREGELLVVEHLGQGRVWRLVPAAAADGAPER